MEKITGAIKRAISAWRTRFSAAGPAGKIGIGCVTLLALFCVCSVPLAIITPNPQPDLEPAASDRTQEIAIAEDEQRPEATQESEKETIQEPAATYTDQPTYTPQPTHTTQPTYTPIPTNTPIPTDTPLPTATGQPTNTPLPTYTPTPPATPTAVSPTDPPPTAIPPTQPPPTEAPPTQPPPTAVPPTEPPARTEPPPPPAVVTAGNIVIINVNKRDEFVDIRNDSGQDIDLGGWILISEKGNQECRLAGIISAGGSLRIWAMTEDAGQGGFNCNFDSNIWNNSDPDPAVLKDPTGEEVSRR